MNETPRTNAALTATYDAGYGLGPEHEHLVDLCRTLETELALAQRPQQVELDDDGTDNAARHILAVMLEGDLDDFLQWYKPEQWLGIHRAVAGYLVTHFVRRDDKAIALLREAIETGGLANDLVRDRIDAYLAKVR